MRSSKPSKRDGEERERRRSAASSSTTACVSGRPLRRERDHRAGRRAAVGGLERRGDDVDAQHHPRAAAVRLVVDLAGAQRRRLAVVEETQLELGAEDARDRPLLGEPGDRRAGRG